MAFQARAPETPGSQAFCNIFIEPGLPCERSRRKRPKAGVRFQAAGPEPSLCTRWQTVTPRPSATEEEN